jgi:mannose-1-phosphate guanylyltransferase
MERADNIAVATGRFRWYDVGSWPALADHFPADADGNVCVGRCATLDAAANIVVSRERLTALIGVRDLIVVQAGNATLVCRRDRAQDVRALVRKLEEDGGNKDVL